MAVALLITGYYRNPKLVAAVAEAGPLAEVLWARALDHCAEHDTDGRIAKHMPDVILARPSKKQVAALVKHGCWHEADNPHDGYDIHDYTQWNRPAAELAAARKAKSEVKSRAGKAGAAARWNGRLSSVANDTPMAGA